MSLIRNPILRRESGLFVPSRNHWKFLMLSIGKMLGQEKMRNSARETGRTEIRQSPERDFWSFLEQKVELSTNNNILVWECLLTRLLNLILCYFIKTICISACEMLGWVLLEISFAQFETYFHLKLVLSELGAEISLPLIGHWIKILSSDWLNLKMMLCGAWSLKCYLW